MERKKGGLHFDWFMSFLIAVCLYFAFNIIQQQKQLNAVECNYGEVQLSLDTARQKNKELKEERDLLRSHEYIEKVAREELGMTRKGEMPYISSAKR